MMKTDNFIRRHIGPQEGDVSAMLERTGVSSLGELIDKTVPASIRLKKPLDLPEGVGEYDYFRHIRSLASLNKTYRSYIGLGYYDCIVPAVIRRNILENPGWYTAYTPYQAEIAQGRLEGLLNFQTMVADLTGMPIANASLLDEGTAAAEAMTMLFNSRSREQSGRNANRFFVSGECFPQTIAVLQSRAEPVGIEIVTGDHREFDFSDRFFGALVQYPSRDGEVHDYSGFVQRCAETGIKTAVASDLLSLALLKPPGEWGADVVVGNSQRFGVPVGYGGPHAAFFATREEFKRVIPGRIIGVSVDRQGTRALRMALQTREQHIRRDKATSNICTAQALLAVMAGMYAVYHGASGIRTIAGKIHNNACQLATELQKLGYRQLNQGYFDTLCLKLPGSMKMDTLHRIALEHQVNFRYVDDRHVVISLDETTDVIDVHTIISIFAKARPEGRSSFHEKHSPTIESGIPAGLARTTSYLTHEVFNRYHSETEMMRYLKRLENKDLSLTHSMISLGSCTMKLNAASELYPITFPEFAGLHPFVPVDQAKGYTEVFQKLEKWLCEITGFGAISLQPNSGAQGEYAGLMVIREYHKSRGEGHRNVALIPSSAHGTNPASAVMAGMKVVVVKCDERGNIDIADLKQKAEVHQKDLSSLMITYPSTHGVFEEGITEITKIIHECGGLVYMDGANMNAQVGITNPATIGADVCHLNLHKTFAIPHGGGGPGMGPIAVTSQLAPFLPGHPVVQTGGEKGIAPVSSAPWGSALILLISYGYLEMLGKEGIEQSTRMAILNANYIRAQLEPYYPVLYKGKNGFIAHEMILDCRQFKKTAQVEVEDIAKRLIDYGFHAPTVSFPVPGTMMIEPTESESREELDLFCKALISIRGEIREIEEGKADPGNNVLKNAPHTSLLAVSGTWEMPYSRERAVFPAQWLKSSKYWPPVSRIDNAFGDRNLICTCPPVVAFETEADQVYV